MRRERTSYLLHQFMSGALTPAERQEIVVILQEDADHVQMVIAEMLEEQTASPSFDKVYWQDMLEKILSVDKPSVRQVTRTQVKIFSLVRWAATAAILIMVTGGVYLWQNRQHTAPQKQAAQHHDDISPGRNKAVLTLADGSTIVLDEANAGELVREGNTTIRKLTNGQLVYTADQQASQHSSVTTFNTINIPRGGQYQLVLPDGTQVWLNAGSSLKYPTSFTGRERKVELTGEAYFEVARQKGKVSFIVSVNDMELVVLGTKFNVMAYEDEPLIKTTLLEGKVMVSMTSQQKPETKNQKLLEPGQQAQIYTTPQARMISDEIRVIYKQNPEEEIAWKNGYFIFSSEPIQHIMRKISRWYDIEVEYRGNITTEGFSGTISRFENVSEVLDMLELTGLVHFKLHERRIIVME